MKKKSKGKYASKKKRSAPLSQPPEPDQLPQGKQTWSDIYTAGRPLKTDLVGDRTSSGREKRRLPEVQAAEDALNSSKLLSTAEFLAHYESARKAIDPNGVQEENAPKKRKRARKSIKDTLKNVGSEPGERGATVGLRIIGGRYRGTKLKYSGDNRVRPMKDRVREAVFNLIGTDAKGRHAVDLFAGTGALAFESLSRGAQSATLVEIHFPTARITKENIAVLESSDPALKSKIQLFTTDVFFWGRSLAERFGAEEFFRRDIPWLVFCSPPYDFYVERQRELLELLRHVYAVAPQESLFVIEADERFDFSLLEVEIPKRKRRTYPPAEIAIYKKDAESEPE